MSAKPKLNLNIFNKDIRNCSAFLTPGSAIGLFRIPDLGSRIPNPYFWGLGDNFLGKNLYNSWKIGPNFFLQHIKNKIIFSSVKFVATKNGLTKKNFSPLSFVAVFGSGIRDPGSGMGKNQDPGSGINIPDPPPHCKKGVKFKYAGNKIEAVCFKGRS